MRFRSVEELVGAGLLRRTRTDRRLARRMLSRAGRDLALARDLGRRDAERAATIAYEAGFRACLGILQLQGLRVTSEPGHHRAALEGAAALLGDQFRAAIRELDEARDLRNQSLYAEPAPVTGEVVEAIVESGQQLIAALRARGRTKS